MRSLLQLLLLLLPLAPEAQTGTCAPAQAEATLEGAGVRARLFGNGPLFWRGGDHIYEVPKGTGRQAIFAADLWLSGEIGGEPRFAGSDYGPYEFWPGPLAPDGGPPSTESCAEHDRIWTVTLADVARYNDTGEATDDLREWPAHLGAPVIDGDGIEDNYELASGDRPDVKGGVVAWWIMNDRGDTHDWSERLPLGVEVRVTASTVSPGIADGFFANEYLADLVRYSTHYTYEITYRGTAPLDDLHVGLFADADLGFFSDDYVGTAPEAHMVYAYNGDDFDEGSAGYGEQPPAIGIVAGPPSGDAVTRGGVVFKNGNVLGVWNVDTAEAMLRGLQSDASGPWRYGGVGNAPGAPPTDWTFPVLPPGFWSEANLDGNGTANTPADRRMMISQGPYTLTDGEKLLFEIAIPWARAESGGALGSARLLTSIIGPLAAALPVAAPDDIATIGMADPRAEGDGGEPPPPRGDPTSFGLAPTPEPNPVRAGSTIRYSAPGAGPIRLAVYDALGREVAVPLDGPATVGYNRLPLDARGLAPGAYTYRMTVDGRRHPTVGRFVVIR